MAAPRFGSQDEYDTAADENITALVSSAMRLYNEALKYEMVAPRSVSEEEGEGGGGGGGGGDEYVTAVASLSSCASDEVTQYVTASMDEVQILAAIEKSREQGWSEVADHVREGAVGASLRGLTVEDQGLWEKLKKEAPHMFIDSVPGLKLGQLIAEGGEAHIYEASQDGSKYPLVAKVFKMEGFSLVELHRQWPREKMSSSASEGISGSNCPLQTIGGRLIFDFEGDFPNHRTLLRVLRGSFLEDGRFVFLSEKYSGDLRSFINLKLKDYNGQGPPFSFNDALYIISNIAKAMKRLHNRGSLHRDLKAANVLYIKFQWWWKCVVADYESSMLVQGTRFWRAPEVLEDLLKKQCERNKDVWTEKVDIYSFAMTCYEVLTGDIPFVKYMKSDWQKVIAGERPHLPDYVDSQLGELVKRCWHKEPCERPSFDAIVQHLEKMPEKDTVDRKNI